MEAGRWGGGVCGYALDGEFRAGSPADLSHAFVDRLSLASSVPFHWRRGMFWV